MVKTNRTDIAEKNYLPIFLRTENSHRKLSAENDKEVSNFRRALPQILAVSIQNLLQFGYGMTQGFPTIAIPAIQNSSEQDDNYGSIITLNKEQISWLSSINLICMPLGCLFSGMFAQFLGKRLAMQVINIPMLAAWLLFYYSTCTEHMYLALCLIGMAGGLMEAPVITYVAEITDPKYRGMFSALATTCVSMGVFTQFMLGSMMHWRTVALVSTVVPIFSVVMLCFVPESPVWLIRKRCFLDAVKALQWLRGWVPEHKVEGEFKQLYDELITQKSANQAVENNVATPIRSLIKRKLHMWRKRSFVVPFLLVLFTFFVCHFSGKTPLRTYAVPIFETLKTPLHKNHATILLGTSEMFATILGAALIHSTGKRPLVLTSTLGTGICILGIAIYAYSLNLTDLTGLAVDNENMNTSSGILKQNVSSLLNESGVLAGDQLTTFLPDQIQENSYLAWLPLLLVLCAAFFANLGIRMIPWVLIGEVFPAEIRNSASGFAGCMGYIFGFLANKLFLVMLSVMTFPGAFFFYASVSLVGIIILYFMLPETEGFTLGEIEAHFSKKSNFNLFHKSPVVSKRNENLSNDEIESLKMDTQRETNTL